jgi:hypothetical protein
MDLGQFLLRLQRRDADASAADVAALLQASDEVVRIDAPGLPPLDLATAIWAVQQLQSACGWLAAVDLGAELTATPACPGDRAAAATHYSVDLVLRHLPALLSRAAADAIAADRQAALRRLAHAWPLSSVGIAGLGPVDVGPLLACDGLRRLYVDRILRRGDRERAGDPAVAPVLAALVEEHRAFARGVLAVHDAAVNEAAVRDGRREKHRR